MAARAPSPRSIVRRDLIALASVSFSAEPLLMGAMLYFTKGDWLGWIFAGCAVVMMGTAFVVGRRTLRKVTWWALI
jgi:hypothetical protein